MHPHNHPHHQSSIQLAPETYPSPHLRHKTRGVRSCVVFYPPEANFETGVGHVFGLLRARLLHFVLHKIRA